MRVMTILGVLMILEPAAAAAPASSPDALLERGIELRAAGHYGEALDAWERALTLAPDNRVYEANVARLREQLENLRRAERQLADWNADDDD